MAGEGTPHAEQSLLTMGTPLEEADAAVLALHGRGATARSILQIVSQLGVDDVAGVAPQASRNTWYPTSFLEPLERNEPWLSAALNIAVGISTTQAVQNSPVAFRALLYTSLRSWKSGEYVMRSTPSLEAAFLTKARAPGSWNPLSKLKARQRIPYLFFSVQRVYVLSLPPLNGTMTSYFSPLPLYLSSIFSSLALLLSQSIPEYLRSCSLQTLHTPFSSKSISG